MRRHLITGISAMTLVFILALTACGDQSSTDPLSSDATLKSIKVAGVEASLGTPGSAWNSSIAGAVGLPDSRLTSAAVQVTSNGSGVIVYYAVSEAGVTPVYGEAATFDFDYGKYLYIEVFSANHDAVQFYHIEIVPTTPTISDITLDGRSASGGRQISGVPIPQFGTGVGSYAASWNAVTDPGEIWFGTSQSGTALPVTVTPTNTVEGAVTAEWGVAAGDTEPTFGTENVTPTDGAYLYIKLQSHLGEGFADKEETVYYKILLKAKGDNLQVSKVTIDETEMAIGVMGTHSFQGQEAWGSYSNGALLATTGNNGLYSATDTNALASVTVSVTTAATNTVTYGHAMDDHGSVDITNTTGVLTNLQPLEYIAVEVTSELGTKGWYKFRVTAGSTDTGITQISVGSSTATPLEATVAGAGISAPVPASVPAISNATLGALLSITLSHNAATISRYATFADLSAPSGGVLMPSYTNAPTGGIPVGGQVYYLIEVTAQNKVATALHWVKIVPTVSTPPELTALSIQGDQNPATYQYDYTVPVTLGTPATSIGSATAGSVTISADKVASNTTGLICSGVSDSPQYATIYFTKTTGATPDANTVWVTTTYMSFWGMQIAIPPSFTGFANNDMLWVKVIIGETANYYKIAVTVE